MRRSFLLSVLVVAAASGQERTEADDPRRLRAELLALRKEIRDLKARLAHLEQQMATIAPVASDATRPALDPALGFVVPNVPLGSGSDSPTALATSLHQHATSSEHDLDKLLAFGRIEFLVPEALWTQAAKGLKTVSGLPTRDELDRALGALRRSGPGAGLTNVHLASSFSPQGGTGCLQVVDFDVSLDKRTDQYRLTAVKLCGRWYAAHLLALAAEAEAEAFLLDVWESQRAYFAFRQGRYAKNLQELAGARDLEKNPNIKGAGLSFPLGGRIDRFEKDRMEWVANGDEVRGPFYRFVVTSDEKGGWSALAVPRMRSYATFSVEVPANADTSRKPRIERRASPGDGTSADPGRRLGQPEGD